MQLSKVSAAVAATLLMAAPAFAADLAAPPTWSADQVRAVRPLAPAPALVFEVERTVTVGQAAPKVSHDRVEIAPTFTHIVRDGGAETLYDHSLCRRFDWTAGKPLFASQSCYALPAFKALELANRRRIADALRTKNKEQEPARPFWVEAELGVADAASKPLAKRSADGATDYAVGTEVLVHETGEAGTLGPEEAKRVARYLALEAPLHPQARRDLAAGTRLPQRFDLAFTVGDDSKVKQSLVISHLRHATLAYPLPAGLRSALDPAALTGDTPVQQGLRQAVLAATGRSKVAKPTETALIDAIQADLKAGRSLSALFRFFNLSDQYGGRLTNDAAQAETLAAMGTTVQAILADPAAGEFWAASHLAADPTAVGDRPAAAAYLAKAPVDALPYATFRYVTLANLLANPGDPGKWDPALVKSLPGPLADDYWRHIAAYPWSSNTFKDLGDRYYRDFDPVTAWLAYDLGRAIDPDWKLGPMKALSDFEDRLRADQSDFF